MRRTSALSKEIGSNFSFSFFLRDSKRMESLIVQIAQKLKIRNASLKTIQLQKMDFEKSTGDV